MLKRLLLALDIDDDSPIATQYAKAISERFQANVTGLAVINTHAVNAEIGPGGSVGGAYYAEKIRARRMREERALAFELADTFEEEMETSALHHVEHVSDGVPYKRIAEEMKYADLLVIGREPHFFNSRPDRKTNTLARIVKHGVSPSLVVPDAYREVRRVLVAYDASDPAARTMQKFAQLRPFGTDLRIEIVHVRSWVGDHFTKRSEQLLSLAAEYLGAHGFETVRTMSLDLADPQARIMEYAREFEADLIVAGAHSMSAVKRVAFGSTTHTLLQGCPIPFFLFH